MCHACTPDLIVVGGGLARATEGALTAGIARRLADRDFSNVSWDVSVRDAARGDEAGLAGAAAWWQARPETQSTAQRRRT
jgi:predicted NBD/HSP70 family sugar kinase